MKYKIGDIVILKNYKDSQYNREGRILAVDEENELYWISNLNMPFMGTISDKFSEDELELR